MSEPQCGVEAGGGQDARATARGPDILSGAKFLALALAFGLSACSPENAQNSGKPLVATTTTMVTDLAKIIGGERVDVRGLMGPGIDPHSYVPKLADTSLLEKADLVLYSGLHLEGRFQDSLEAMAKRGRNVVAVTDGIPPGNLLAPQEDFEGTKDPHVWGDPALWVDTIAPVVAALSKVDPAGAEEFLQRGDDYRQELSELAEWVSQQVSEIPEGRRVLVTSHDAFFYFGRAFAMEVRGLQGVSTAAEAGIKDRTDLVEFLRERGVKTVFPETSINRKGIAAVAAEAGVAVSDDELFSDALGAPGDVVTVDGVTYDRGTYSGMIRHNVNSIVKGLR
jgi:manganese/zinc/iron transport system substrate-binding protein